MINNDLLVAKILLALTGNSDPYTEALLGGAVMALRIQKELYESEGQSSVDTSGVGEVPQGSGQVQPDDSPQTQTVDETGQYSGEFPAPSGDTLQGG
jgi:hypothetical protein